MRPALNELVGKYKNNLYAVAFNICKNPDDAEDAVQDTFVQYFSNKKEFETEPFGAQAFATFFLFHNYSLQGSSILSRFRCNPPS